MALSEEVAAALVGKTVAKVVHGSYLGWAMTVAEIHFTDGSVLELSGNADSARIESLRLPGGGSLDPEFPEEA